MIAFHVPNPITVSRSDASLTAPFAVFKLLEALAPSLVSDRFSAVPGGLHLHASAVDVIIDPDVALKGHDQLDYVRQHGHDLVVVADTPNGLVASTTIRCDEGVKCIADMRPWFQVSCAGLIFVAPMATTHGHGGPAVLVSPNAAARLTSILCRSTRQMEKGFEDAHVLAGLWRDVLTMGRAGE
jgi:hypothetical protein